MWENYIVSERRKRNAYSWFYGHSWFWRTRQQQEIDYIEETDGNISAFEFKWNSKKTSPFSLTFTKNYHPVNTAVINPDNYDSFLM